MTEFTTICSALV